MEKLNEQILQSVSSQLRQAMIGEKMAGEKVRGMDWSRRIGKTGVSNVDDFKEGSADLQFDPFIVVHGAGVQPFLVLKAFGF